MKIKKRRSPKVPKVPVELNVFEHHPLVRAFPTIPLVEIRRAFEPIADRYPPILSLKQAAELAGVAPSTLKRLVSEGQYKDCVSRGRPLRFSRDRFAQAVMKDKKKGTPGETR